MLINIDKMKIDYYLLTESKPESDLLDFCDENNYDYGEVYAYLADKFAPDYCRGCKFNCFVSRNPYPCYPCNECSRLPRKDMYEGRI